MFSAGNLKRNTRHYLGDYVTDNGQKSPGMLTHRTLDTNTEGRLQSSTPRMGTARNERIEYNSHEENNNQQLLIEGTNYHHFQGNQSTLQKITL